MAEKYYQKSLDELKSKKKVPEALLAKMKSQAKAKSLILKTLTAEGKTVPEIAEEIGLPAHEVLFFISALRKYGKITENGKKGDYHRYIKS